MNLSLVFGRGSTGLNTVGPSSRLSASSSYSKGWYVDKPSLFPTPGGELLWRVSRPARNFRLATSPAETCENGRLPGTATSVRISMVLVLHKSKAMGECITLGYSREPPVATFFGPMQRSDEYREVVWYMPKRLPSRLWEQTSLVDVPNLRGRGATAPSSEELEERRSRRRSPPKQ